MKTFECVRCKEARPVNEFYQSELIERGHYAYCRYCASKQQKKTRGKRLAREELENDEVDWWRVTSYLKSARVPITALKKAEIVAEWNESTNWVLPYVSGRDKELEPLGSSSPELGGQGDYLLRL
jgi:DNA-directed RNA polymerase subunit RPC12/RpoP